LSWADWYAGLFVRQYPTEYSGQFIHQQSSLNPVHATKDPMLSGGRADVEQWLDLSELIDQVQELLDIGLDKEATDLLDRYAEVYKGAWEIDFLYSRIYTDTNQSAKAIECLFRCLKTEKNNLDVLMGFFYAYSQMGDMRRAIRFLNRAARLFPKHELVLSAQVWYYNETSDLKSAIQHFEESRAILEDNPDVLRNVGIAYERNGDYEKARACFGLALQINPGFDEARDLLADHYILCGEPENAITLYQDYLKISPNNIKALSRLVFCFSQNNQVDEAEEVARNTIRLYPNSPVGYVDLSYMYLNSGRLDQSIEAAGKALDVSPIDPEAHRVRGIAYSESTKNSDAEAAFESAMACDPENPEIMRDYYHHLRNAGKTEEMKALVQKVIKLEKPYCMEDYWFLADYYQAEGQMLMAFHYLHRAYKSMPGEKELIPPMVDILLEKRHNLFALSYLKRYAESKGWNEVMDEFVRHKRLRGKLSQEGLRFLRFYSQKPHEFRSYIFYFYLRKFGLVTGLGVFPAITALVYLFAGLRAALWTGGSYALVFTMLTILVVLAGRKRSTSANERGIGPEVINP
jgi:tetratricopeptide (TPR) repeat protein